MQVIISVNNKFLNKDSNLVDSILQSAIFEIERIDNSSWIKIKCCNKYLSCVNNKIQLTDTSNEYSIFKYNQQNLECICGNLIQNNTNLEIDNSTIYRGINFGLNSNNITFITDEAFDIIKNGVTTICTGKQHLIDKSREIIESQNVDRVHDLFKLDFDTFMNILDDHYLHSILKKIYPNGYHCTTYSSNTLYKDVNNSGWHTDYPYHDIPEPYPDEVLGVQVLWTLNDFTEENGATHFVPGSHTKGTFPKNLENEEIGRMTTKKGTLIIYLGSLWHTQGVNLTNIPRSALLANFAPLHVKPKDAMNTSLKPLRKYINNENQLVFT